MSAAATQTGEPVIELNHVTFRWPGQAADTVAIDELQLQSGEHLFVRGASGSGKTTLLNLLAGIHTPTTGEIRLLGTNLGSLSPSGRDRFRANHIGVVFQQFNLLPYLSVLENVVISCAFSNRKRDRATRDDTVDATARRLLKSLSLSDELHTAPVAKLSVGQQQRVAVARALIGGPEILIADEPTSALDADNRDRFLDLLFQEVAAQSCTLIFVSHDPQLADRFDSRDRIGRTRASPTSSTMTLLRIALKSARFRRTSLILTIVSIAISVTLLLGVDVVRKEAKSSFLNTISQTDLIVGARSGPTNLLLYSVFHIGSATNNVTWESYETIAARDEVAWTVPISLGDSHRGFRVMGTTEDYFEFYQYGNKNPLEFDRGTVFADVYDTVLGAEVARSLSYEIGDEIIISHGLVSADFAAHDDKPFTVVGVLERTGTPVDRAVHVSLAGIEAIHIDWQGAARSGLQLDADQALQFDLTPTAITAFMVGLDNPALTFRTQREINDYAGEPLSAITPGSTLAEFWRTISTIEQVLFVMSGFVLVAGLLGMITTLLSTLNERRREIAVLRAIGARPSTIVLLIALETLLIVVAGCVVGVALLYALLAIARPIVAERVGIDLSLPWLDSTQGLLLGAVIVGATLVSLIPGFIAYRRSIQDGLAVRV